VPANSADDLFRRLRSLGIPTRTRVHPPVFTVEEAKRLRGEVPGWHVKNLFLRDKKGTMWLVCAPENRSVDLKHLATLLSARGRLSFGSEARLRTFLGVSPGTVTPFAVMNDRARVVEVVLDQALLNGPPVNFHPLENTKTTTISPDGLLAFLEAEHHPPRVVNLSGSAAFISGPEPPEPSQGS
jgi:Ala-tRNA(Pro) deacylase